MLNKIIYRINVIKQLKAYAFGIKRYFLSQSKTYSTDTHAVNSKEKTIHKTTNSIQLKKGELKKRIKVMIIYHFINHNTKDNR